MPSWSRRRSWKILKRNVFFQFFSWSQDLILRKTNPPHFRSLSLFVGPCWFFTVCAKASWNFRITNHLTMSTRQWKRNCGAILDICVGRSLCLGTVEELVLDANILAFSLHLCRRLFFGCQLACSPLIATTLWALIISRQKNCRLDNLVLSELPPESFMIYIYIL